MKFDRPFRMRPARKAGPQASAPPVPAGWYDVEIVDDERKETAACDGTWYLLLKARIVRGPHRGRRIYTMLHAGGRSKGGREYAAELLAQLADSVGVDEFTDTAELHHRTVRGFVKINEGGPGYPDRNAIAAFEPLPDNEDVFDYGS